MQVLPSQLHFLANRNVELAVPPLLWPCSKLHKNRGACSIADLPFYLFLFNFLCFFRQNCFQLFTFTGKNQEQLIRKAKEFKEGVVLAGDGRHNSMGHSAKFCAYSMFCCTLGKIIHFDLVQVGYDHFFIINLNIYEYRDIIVFF